MIVTVFKPNVSLSRPFLQMLADYDLGDPENGEFYASARIDFNAYVQALSDEERGLNLPQGFVPCSHRWLINEVGMLVGIVRIRHNIDTPFLANEANSVEMWY